MSTLRAANGRLIDPTAGWYSAQDLAGLPGLPTTDRGVKITAQKNLWISRSKERGKGIEYSNRALPDSTRDYLARLAHDLIASLPAPQTPAPPAPLVKPLPAGAVAARGQVRRAAVEDQIDEKQRVYRDSALILCQAIDEAMALSACSARRACEELAARLVAGRAHDELLEAARQTYLKPRKNDLSPLGSVASQAGRLARMHAFFERGRLQGDAGRYLVPGKREATGHHPVHVGAFLRFFCRPNRPTVAETYQQMQPWLIEQGLPAPSYATVCRIQQDLPVTVKYRGRVTGSAWRSLLPYIERDLSQFHSNDLWVGDGHSFKARVQHPIHGQPFVPEVTVVLDWVSRKIVGWSVALSESTLAVSDAFRHAQKTTRARPLVYYSDNGSGQTGTRIDAPIVGTLARQGIAHHTGIPGNPQGRGVIERLWQTVFIPLARTYPTCTWRGADENHTNKIIKLMQRKDGGGIRAPSFRQFCDDLEKAITAYNLHHVHSDLGKTGSDGTPEGEYQARIDKDSIVFGPSDDEIALLWMPEVIRTPSRGVVSLFGNAYFRKDLVSILPEGGKVRVRYDLHDASKVWLLTPEGRSIGEAVWNGNAKAAFPVSEIDLLRAQRAAGKIARAEQIIAEAQAELGEVFEDAGVDPIPMPSPETLPSAAPDEDGSEPNPMSHADLVQWLYGGATDEEDDAGDAEDRKNLASG